MVQQAYTLLRVNLWRVARSESASLRTGCIRSAVCFDFERLRVTDYVFELAICMVKSHVVHLIRKPMTLPAYFDHISFSKNNPAVSHERAVGTDHSPPNGNLAHM